MNDEIGNFIIKFTTEGFDKVEKSLNELNKGLDKVNESLGQGEKKGESFFGALVKWTGLVGGLTLAFNELKKVINDVFGAAEQMTTLFKKEEDLGVEAKVLERYGLIARRNKGSQNDAYAFFEGVQNLMLKASTPALWTEEDAKGLALAGINWSYDRGMSAVANRDAYLVALRQAFMNNMYDPTKRSYLKKYVPQESLYTFFGAQQADFDAYMQWADRWSVLSKDPSRLQGAQNLETTKIEWQQIWQKIDVELIPILDKILNALKPLEAPMLKMVDKLGKWVDENADKIAGWVEQGVNWLIQNGPEILNGIGNTVQAIASLAQFLSPLVSWAAKELGGTWAFVKDFGKWLMGDMSWDDINEKYKNEGGGLFGWAMRGGNRLGELLTAPTSAQVSWARNYNTTNNYGGKVVVEAGWHPDTRVVDMSRPTGATVSSLYKGV